LLTPYIWNFSRTLLLFGATYISAPPTISAGFFRYPPASFALQAPLVVGGLLVRKIR
jgi:hypothetical protein